MSAMSLSRMAGICSLATCVWVVQGEGFSTVMAAIPYAGMDEAIAIEHNSPQGASPGLFGVRVRMNL